MTPKALAAAAAMKAMAAWGAPCQTWAMRKGSSRMGEALREYLAGRDAPCPRCGYNLRGLAGAECPECGLALSVARLKEEAEHREWRERRMPRDPITTAGLIGSILSLGWPLALLVLGVLLRDATVIDARRLGMLALVCIVQAGLVVVYLGRSMGGLAGMKDWPRRRKMWLAVLAWCWGPGAIVGMIVWEAVF